MAPRRAWSLAIGLAACQIALAASGCGGGHTSVPAPPGAAQRIDMGSDFANAGTLPRRFTCQGAGTAPPVTWGAVPAKTAEVVLVVSDPDAPDGRFVHWTVFGIPPTAHALPHDAREGRNSAGKTGWTPACPPHGERHRYVFDLYALAARSGLPQDAAPAEVIAAVRGALARGELEAFYG